MVSTQELDLFAVDLGLDIEAMPDGAALAASGCFSSATSASTASCPASSASSFTTASSYSG